MKTFKEYIQERLSDREVADLERRKEQQNTAVCPYPLVFRRKRTRRTFGSWAVLFRDREG